MSGHDNDTKTELAILGRGISRTFIGDLLSASIGAVIGVLLVYFVMPIVGFAGHFGITSGALFGAAVGFLLHSTLKPLFNYGPQRRK